MGDEKPHPPSYGLLEIELLLRYDDGRGGERRERGIGRKRTSIPDIDRE